MGAFQVITAVVCICAVSCLIMFVIILKDIDPPPIKDNSRTRVSPILRRSTDGLHVIANLTDEAKDEDFNIDKIVEDIVSTSLEHLNNASDDNVTEISNSFLTRLRSHLFEDIKRAIPRIIQTEDDVAKLQAKINTNDHSFVTNDDVVAINITDALGQPLVELKLYSYKGDTEVSEGDIIYRPNLS